MSALRSLRVVNALGRTVLTRTHDGAETMVVTTGTLPAGLYLLHLTDTAGAIRTLRFAKQ
ncbi:MAG: T9SS type A sorting domain-containing protein [Bacteroidia bacterium]|nr:T9SS type A sorting domain-containing protein [Bacteroidia bacterium]